MRSKGGGANMDMIRLGEACYSWFIDHYYPGIDIGYFGSKYKTQILGAPQTITKIKRSGPNKGQEVTEKMKKYDRKKWSVEKCFEILELRKDQDGIDLLGLTKRGKQKLDDIADCVTMTQAFKYKELVVN